MQAPKTKKEFFKLWTEGRLGNKIHTFDTYHDLQNSPYQGRVTVRYKIPGTNICKYYVPVQDVPSVMNELGGQRDLYTFNESAPDEEILCQGELCRNYQGFYLYYSTAKLPMRQALRDHGQHVTNTLALAALRHFVWPKSYDMLMELLEYDHSTQETAIVEFSTYKNALGIYPGHNTIIWEVRGY